MLTNPPRTAVRARRSTGGSLLLQLVPLLIASAIPALGYSIILGQPWFVIQQINNSAIGATVAVFLANYFVGRMATFSGVKAFRYILPCHAMAYGVLLAVVLIGRVSYSSIYFAVSFIISVCTFTTFRYVSERSIELSFYIVPFGRTDFIKDLPGIEWRELPAPRLPDEIDVPIVADLRFDLPDAWERMLADAALRGQAVYHTKQLRESLTGQVSIEHLSENSFGSLVPNLAYARVKRLIDICVSIIILPLLALPLLLLAVAIRLESPGPALFRQTRAGAGGHSFRVYKFRSMYQSKEHAPLIGHQHAITLQNDARVTRIGRIIRRYRIDEIPQLINVFKGEMSLIGPRPEAVDLSQWYEEELPFYVYRHVVRPGITGWAQVEQGHVTDLESVRRKLHYDFYYIKNYSAWIDILITIRTIGIMLSGFGSK